MPPVDTPRLDTRGSHFVKMPVFLPQFVGEKKRHDEQRNYQKNAQYQVLDHGGLRSQEHDFIVEHRAYPYRAAALAIARSRAIARLRQHDAKHSPKPHAAARVAKQWRTEAGLCKNSPPRALTNWNAPALVRNARSDQ